MNNIEYIFINALKVILLNLYFFAIYIFILICLKYKYSERFNKLLNFRRKRKLLFSSKPIYKYEIIKNKYLL